MLLLFVVLLSVDELIVELAAGLVVEADVLAVP